MIGGLTRETLIGLLSRPHPQYFRPLSTCSPSSAPFLYVFGTRGLHLLRSRGVYSSYGSHLDRPHPPHSFMHFSCIFLRNPYIRQTHSCSVLDPWTFPSTEMLARSLVPLLRFGHFVDLLPRPQPEPSTVLWPRWSSTIL